MSSTSDNPLHLHPLRLGVVGLGRGFTLTAHALMQHPNIRLIAAASRTQSALDAFKEDFGGKCYHDIDELCADANVEMIYIATPHGIHREHAVKAAEAGKHIVVEKPISITLNDADEMVKAADAADVHLIVGPSHSFDGPVCQAAELIASGQLGNVKMIQAFNATDFLYRPRRFEELDTSQGGGVIYSQAIHQVDIVRKLMHQKAKNVVAMTGSWDDERPTEGAYSALIGFENGFASITYSGYARFDSDSLMKNIGELGRPKPDDHYGSARRKLATTTNEQILKRTRAYHGINTIPQASYHEHFGPFIIYCENGDVRLHPDGIEVFANDRTSFHSCHNRLNRYDFCESLVQAVKHNNPPVQNGQWGRASLEICDAILQSAQTQTIIQLQHQGNSCYDGP